MNVSDDFAVSPIVCEPCVSGDVCDLNEEGEQARTMNVGHKPSVEEVNMHNLTHIPFRSWCPFCVAGKAKDNPHNRVEDQEAGVNIIDMDYMFLNSNEPDNVIAADDEEAEEEPEEEVARSNSDNMPVLVYYDRRHKYIFARVCLEKEHIHMPFVG